MWFIQFIESASDKPSADQLLTELARQVDYRGGRILPPVNQEGKTSWRVQAFFQDAEHGIDSPWLPDGCRRVFVPISLHSMLGIQL